MTYVPPNAAAAANRASRLRKKIADGKPLTHEEQAFLDARGTPKRGRAPSRATAPAPAREPAPVHHEAPPDPPRVETPPPSPSPSREPEYHVIDFGKPADSIVKPNTPACPPGCQHTSHAHAAIPRCAINGEKQYPPFKDSAAKGTANVAFFVTGVIIAFFRGMDFDLIPDPTPGELQDGADAVKEIVATRAPQLGIYSDLMAGGFAISAYGMRTANLPKEKKREP